MNDRQPASGRDLLRKVKKVRAFLDHHAGTL